MSGGENSNNSKQTDMSRMKICNTCGKPIAKSAKVCPYCGARQKKPFYKKPVFWILVVVIVLIAAGTGSSGSKKSVTVEPSAAATAEAKTETAGAETAAEETDTPADTAAETAPADTAIAMNTPVEVDDGLTLTVLSAGAYDTGNQFEQPADGKMYYRVEIELVNNSSSDIAVSSIVSFSAYADDYSIDEAFVGNQDTLDGTVAAGKKIRGSLIYEIPTDCHTLQIDYKSNVWVGRTFTMTFQIQ